MGNHLLTFEYDQDNDKLEIHVDEKGLTMLKEKIEYLLKKGGDIHLMSPSWAGQELSEEKQNERSVLINHVKIIFWK